MYRSSPFRSTLNTSYITGLDMCKVCTEAVHSVALWTRVTSLVWTCVKYVPKQSIPWHFENVPFYTYGFQSVSTNKIFFKISQRRWYGTRMDMIWYDMIWYDMIWYDMIWYDMTWYDMIWYLIDVYWRGWIILRYSEIERVLKFSGCCMDKVLHRSRHRFWSLGNTGCAGPGLRNAVIFVKLLKLRNFLVSIKLGLNLVRLLDFCFNVFQEQHFNQPRSRNAIHTSANSDSCLSRNWCRYGRVSWRTADQYVAIPISICSAQSLLDCSAHGDLAIDHGAIYEKCLVSMLADLCLCRQCHITEYHQFGVGESLWWRQ